VRDDAEVANFFEWVVSGHNLKKKTPTASQ
jgi:hypothetical protein